jgi:hypothetical protein
MFIKNIYEVTHDKDNPEYVTVKCKNCGSEESMHLSDWIQRTKYSPCRECRKHDKDSW